MMTIERAEKFTAQWLAAWNAHDLEGILAHYTEEVEARSPMIAKLTGDQTGTIRGKDALRGYFALGLEKYPDLRFELLGTFLGVDGLCVHYRGVGDLPVVECIQLDPADRVVRVAVHYAAPL